ncbi:Abi family protein [Latilactobacillus sakei]
MSRSIKGRIIEINKQFGTIEYTNSDSNNQKINFLVTDEFLNANGEFFYSENVFFKTMKPQFRNRTIILAKIINTDGPSSVIPYTELYGDEIIFNFLTTKVSGLTKFSKNELKSELLKHELTYSDIFDIQAYFTDSTFNQNISIEDIKTLKRHDEALKEGFLRWILTVEDVLKLNCLTFINNNFDDNSLKQFYSELSSTNKTLVSTPFKRIGQKYIFRAGGTRLTLKTSGTTISVVSAPLDIFLNELTISELSSFIEFLLTKYADEEDFNFDILAICQPFLNDISFIRNIAAHGRTLLPTLLDKTYNPNYTYDSSAHSPFPESSIEDIKTFPLFEVIRFSLRMSLKGKSPNRTLDSLDYVKQINDNPALRSFFSLYCVLNYLTNPYPELMVPFFEDVNKVFSLELFPTVIKEILQSNNQFRFLYTVLLNIEDFVGIAMSAHISNKH